MLPGTAVTGLSGSYLIMTAIRVEPRQIVSVETVFFYCRKGRMTMFDTLRNDMRVVGYRTFRVGFNADGASVYRASLAFIFLKRFIRVDKTCW